MKRKSLNNFRLVGGIILWDYDNHFYKEYSVRKDSKFFQNIRYLDVTQCESEIDYNIRINNFVKRIEDGYQIW